MNRSMPAAMILIFAFVMFAVSPSLMAQNTWFVDDDAPGDPGPGDPAVSDEMENGKADHPFDAVQEGVDAASSGDIVLVLDGTYTGAGNNSIQYFGKAITVRSESGPEKCVLVSNDRKFIFDHAETRSAVLDGFTITRDRRDRQPDRYDQGIKIYNNSSPTIRNCIITNHLGGGLQTQDSSPLIVDCLIKDNENLYAGGIRSSGGYPEFRRCVIENNTTGTSGGGMALGGDTPAVVRDCIIRNNRGWSDSYPEGDGGGLAVSNNSIIINCEISGNTAYEYGGGLYISDAPRLHNCVIRDNTAYWGGGIYATSCGPMEINNCLFTGNESDLIGGAISFRSWTDARIANCTIFGNYCYDLYPWCHGGGGIGASFGSPELANLTIVNTILWGNQEAVPPGKEISIGDGWVLDIRYSDVEWGEPYVYVETGGTLNWGAGMMDADPLFTRGPLGMFYLSQTAAGQAWDSLCVDAGEGVMQWPHYLHSVSGTSRTDLWPDTGAIDMGYHYPLEGLKIPPGSALEDVPGLHMDRGTDRLNTN